MKLPPLRPLSLALLAGAVLSCGVSSSVVEREARAIREWERRDAGQATLAPQEPSGKKDAELARSLAQAVYERKLDRVRPLFEGFPVNPNWVVTDGYRGWNRSSLLHIAVRNDSEPIVRFLLEKGVDPNLLDGEGRAPLDLVLERAYFDDLTFDLARVLLDHRADPTARPGREDVLARLRKSKYDCRDNCKTDQKGFWRLLKLLDAYGLDLSAHRDLLCTGPLTIDGVLKVDDLPGARLDLVCGDSRLLFRALTDSDRSDTTKILDVLAKAGADFGALRNAEGKDRDAAARHTLVSWLVADATSGAYSCRWDNATAEYDALLGYLVEKGADVNIPGAGGATPLEVAASSNCKRRKELLARLRALGARETLRTTGVRE